MEQDGRLIPCNDSKNAPLAKKKLTDDDHKILSSITTLLQQGFAIINQSSVGDKELATKVLSTAVNSWAVYANQSKEYEKEIWDTHIERMNEQIARLLSTNFALCHDLLLLIAKSLDFPTIEKARSVCKRWRQELGVSSVYRAKISEIFNMSQAKIGVLDESLTWRRVCTCIHTSTKYTMKAGSTDIGRELFKKLDGRLLQPIKEKESLIDANNRSTEYLSVYVFYKPARPFLLEMGCTSRHKVTEAYWISFKSIDEADQIQLVYLSSIYKKKNFNFWGLQEFCKSLDLDMTVDQDLSESFKRSFIHTFGDIFNQTSLGECQISISEYYRECFF